MTAAGSRRPPCAKRRPRSAADPAEKQDGREESQHRVGLDDDAEDHALDREGLAGRDEGSADQASDDRDRCDTAVLVTGVLFSAPLAPKLKMVIEARTARLSRRPAQRALAGGVLEAASAVG
jgi:hypothetical protein